MVIVILRGGTTDSTSCRKVHLIGVFLPELLFLDCEVAAVNSHCEGFCVHALGYAV